LTEIIKTNDQNNNLENEPLIPWGWLRAVLFFLSMFGVMYVYKIVKGFLLYDNGINSGLEYLFYSSSLKCLAFLLGIFLLRKFIDRKSMVSLGFSFKAQYRKDLLLGIAVGVGMLAILFTILLLSGSIVVKNVQFPAYDLLLLFGLFIVVALREETVSRGYMLVSLMASMNKYWALLATSVIFASFHLDNTGLTPFGFVNLILGGLLLGIYYIHKKNLWFPIGLHFGWNFAIGPIFGSAVSGNQLPGILQLELIGSDIMTGGAFGFEASIFAPILLIATTVFIHFKFR
jgi:membrane protease YdiL (CAAX protease family)